jgi:dTDP-4-amino-4,6-dideoxygalactose transaminase
MVGNSILTAAGCGGARARALPFHRLAEFSGAKHVVSCATGTEALLMAQRIGLGDAVICLSITFCADGEAVALD